MQRVLIFRANTPSLGSLESIPRLVEGTSLLQCLLEGNGVDLSLTTKWEGNTGLHPFWEESGLVGCEYEDSVRLLIDNGASLSARNIAGRTPLPPACMQNTVPTSVVEMLLRAGADD